MGSTPTTRRRHRLRTLNQDGNPQELSSKAPARTPGPRPRHRDTTPQTYRHRHSRRRLALLICLSILGTLSVTARADAAIKGDCPQYHAILKQYGLPPKVFGPIAHRESRCSPKSVSAIRSTGWPDVGLLQVQGSWSSLTMRLCHVKRSQVLKALTRLECQLTVASYLWADGKGASNWSIRSGHHG